MRVLVFAIICLLSAGPAWAQSDGDELSPGDGGKTLSGEMDYGAQPDISPDISSPGASDAGETLQPVYAIPDNNEILDLEDPGQLSPDSLAGIMAMVEQLPPDIKREIMDEGERSQRHCAANYFYSSFYDCGCYGIKTMGTRINSGPGPQWAAIMDETDYTSCASDTNTAGYIYKRCNSTFFSTKLTDRQLEDMCRCVSLTVAKQFANRPVTHINYVDDLFKEAAANCRKKVTH